MKYFCLLAIPFLLLIASCNQKPPTIHERFLALNEADSLALMDSLFAELKVEMYSDRMYDPQVYENNNELCFTSCMPLEPLTIRINSRDQIMVRNKLTDKIYDRVIEYYQYNMDDNHLESNFPLYSRTDKQEILSQIDESKRQAVAVEQTEGVAQDLVDFKWAQVEEWEKKLKVIEILNIDVLHEISSSAHIRLEYQTEDQAYIVDSLPPAFYTLRNDASMKYFNESYLELAFRYSIMNSEEDADRLNALKVLVPIILVDKFYCKKHGVCRWSVYYPQEELPPPPPMPSDY